MLDALAVTKSPTPPTAVRRSRGSVAMAIGARATCPPPPTSSDLPGAIRLVGRAGDVADSQDDRRRHFECRSICRWWTEDVAKKGKHERYPLPGPFPLPTVARLRLLSIQVRFPNLIVQRVRRMGSHRSREGAIPAVRGGENWSSARRSRKGLLPGRLRRRAEAAKRSPSPPTCCELERNPPTPGGLVIFEPPQP